MEFRTVKNVEERRAVVLSPKVWAHHSHWLGNVSVPCDSEKGVCSWCELTKPKRFCGYLLCWDYSGVGKLFYLCITPHAAWDVMNSEQYESGLRGRCILYRRASKSATSKLILRFDSYLERKPDELPQDVNPKPYLDQLYVKNRKKSVQGL